MKNINRPIHAASAIAPTRSHAEAMRLISAEATDLVLGRISIDEVQICPQHAGLISEKSIDQLMEAWPNTRFRLHATPQIAGNKGRPIVDAANAAKHWDVMERMAGHSKRLNAPAYSIHAGRRANATLDEALDTTRRLADLFECRVGIEPLYPTGSDMWLLSSWREHEQLLNSGVDYALDLSHLQIVAHRSRERQDDLVRAMLSSPNCIEVHLSYNDGRADAHLPLDPRKTPWWLDMLDDIHADASIFYEGVLHMPPRGAKPIH